MTASLPVPDVNDPVSEPFWTWLRRGQIQAQRCAECSLLRFPCAALCPNCLSTALEWERLPATGNLWSFVVYHRAFHPALHNEVPYVIGLVDIVEGIRLPGRIVAPRDTISIGMRLDADFYDIGDDITLLQWK